MENNKEILNELRELSPFIAGMEKLNVFTVPAGYFDGLPDEIIAEIKSGELMGSKTFPGSFSDDIPQGYFENLADNILNRIKTQNTENASEELRFLSPMLYSIQSENVFEVPAGYFDGLADTIISSVNPVPAKVIPMQRRSTGFLKYAVAAVFTGVMALGAFQFMNNKGKVIDNPQLAMNSQVIDKGSDIARQNKFDEELAKVDEEDIIKFLEANGTDVNAALVASSIDENELPSQEDYLMDEKALDKYLNSINVNDLNN